LVSASNRDDSYAPSTLCSVLGAKRGAGSDRVEVEVDAEHQNAFDPQNTGVISGVSATKWMSTVL
jgi:hypothetical protein